MSSHARQLLIALFAALLCMTVVGGVQAPTLDRSLSFEDRVVAQRNIEQVYWSHRIWPESNPGPKPALDQVLPDTLIRGRVADYLAKTEALDHFWGRPLTGEQLQAELDRMARDTKNPEVLRELFAALGDDPYVIAECLARPLLVDRLAREWFARDVRFHGAVKEKAEAALATFSGDAARMKDLGGDFAETEWRLVTDSAGTLEPNVERADRHVIDLSAGEWREHIRSLASTFGVEGASILQDFPVNRVSPLTEQDDRFVVTAVLSTGPDRMRMATVSWNKRSFDSWWTEDGRSALVSPDPLTTGAIAPPTGGYETAPTAANVCDVNNSWTPTSTTNAPVGRKYHTAVWTGSEMIVWGGRTAYTPSPFALNDGGRYDPATNSWAPTSTGTNVPSFRYSHTAVWTGTEMIVWGGAYSNTVLNTGGRYDPAGNSWTATSTGTGVPTRLYHTAVWTGTQMIVWGGWGGWSGSSSLQSGGRYDPAGNSWTATSIGTGVPTARYSHTAVWTGTQVIVWGGYDGGFQNSGGRYDPGTDSWVPTSTGANVPAGRLGHTAVWTGHEMIVWAGSDSFSHFDNSGGRYDPAIDGWASTSTVNAPFGRDARTHTAVWTGTRMIVWGGYSDVSPNWENTGGRYDPATNSWTATSTEAGVPAIRTGHSAVWTGTEMIVWGGGTYDTLNNLNTGGRYCECAGASASMWYPDVDEDGYGDGSNGVPACTPPPGYVANGDDCDDLNPNCHDICTDLDGDSYCVPLDCDDSKPNCTTDCTDADLDGWCVTHDCDDLVPGCGSDCTDADGDGFCAAIDCDDGGMTWVPADGVWLTVGPDGVTAEIVLDWTGGQPTFDVYRSTSPNDVTDPANHLGSTSDRSWRDTPPPGAVHFYRVTSPCVPTCPEICDGLDNDCDGAIDEAGGGYQSPVDLPDLRFLDANCDGIAGDLTRAVFVSTSGSDANAGTTRGLPVRTIAQGIAVAANTGRDQVLVEVGNYYGGQLTLQNGIGLYGNYQSGFAQRTATLDVTAYTAAAPTAVVATGVATTTELQYLKLASVGNATPGGSSYGILATDSPGLVVRKCSIVAGLGGAGANGSASGVFGAAGNPGGRGGEGCEDGDGFCVPTCSRPQGGAGGSSSCNAAGGRGGNAGHGGNGGAAGSAGTGGAFGGPGTPAERGNWDTPSTYWGADGQAGAAGFDGYSGGGSYAASGYTPIAGAAGLTGHAGGSGGGGGGGGGGTTGCDSYGGGGGGGGGGSAGGSFAIYLWNSNALIADSRIVTAGGGAGGSGGTGQLGGLGAEGGNCGGGKGNCYGLSNEQQDGSNGGRGGWGGQGGQGGYGGGGAGGPSVGIAAVGNSQPTVTGCTSDIGPSGPGGSSSGFPGPSCGNGVLEQGQRFTYTNSTALAIPDSTGYPVPGPTVSSTIQVLDSFSIADLDVGVDITHLYPGDLWFSITSPGGQEVTLWNRNSCGSNILKTFDDEGPLNCAGDHMPPLGGTPLSTLDGANALGVWTFKINDNWPSDTGTLNSWSLKFARDGNFEQCDDGNRIGGDGCSELCTLE